MTPATWRALQAAASVPPIAARRVLTIAGAAVGSIETTLAEHLLAADLPLRATDGDAIAIEGNTDAALAQVASWLHEQGHAGRWRDELLPVCNDQDHCVARIERAAVRPLGIATHAVHLVGWASEVGESRRQWLQLRAMDKATDPGLWDTMVGGLIAAGESPAQSLERECWEEAGLRLAELGTLQQAGIVTVRRPVEGSGTGGYMIEHIHAMHCTVPPDRVPANLDGEVERFDCASATDVDARIAAGEVTLEAALVIGQCQATRSAAR
jgi:8-oxo-dGTP pyrophosphatase MutT (NUDIX family)